MKIQKYITGLALLIGLLWGQAGAGVIGVSFPDTTVTIGDTVLVPVYMDSSLTGKEALSFQMRIYFYDTYMDIIDVETTGSLAENLSDLQYYVSHTSSYEYLNIAGAGSVALSGKGPLFFIRMLAVSATSTYFYFDNGSVNNFFNQGEPAMQLNHQGPVRIQALPTINISPDNNTLAVGDQLQYAVYSAENPVSWWTGDPSVATIDGNGLLTAVGPGFTKVYVEDNRGVRDSTSTGVRVEPFYIYFNDSTFYDKQTVMIPLYMKNSFASFDIRSGQFQMTFNETYMQILDIHTTGTVLDGVAMEWGTSGNHLNIGFASDAALSGQGTLLFIEVLLTYPYEAGNAYAGISFEQIFFNENLSATYRNGSFRINAVPNLSITPTAGNIHVGQTLQFSSSNGFPPIHWSTSDPAKATIDNNGLLTALSGGNVHVMAVDSLGGSWESGNITINDMMVYLRDTSVVAGQTVEIPVYQMTYRSGIEIYSFQMDFELSDTSHIDFVGAAALGDVFDGWDISYHLEGTRFRVAGASSTPANITGTLFHLMLTIDNTATSGNSLNLTVADHLFNEGLPTANTDGALIQFLDAPSNTVNVAMGADTVEVGLLLNLPVTVGELTGKNIASYEFTFTYDTSVVHISGFEKNGTLSAAMNVIDNQTVPGQYTIAAAGTDTLTGSGGTLLTLKFTGNNIGMSNLHWTSFMFNEGDPGALLSDGMVVVKQETAIETDPGGQLPGNFVLEQNYPNPFNPTTTIRFTLARPGQVDLQVFNAKGQRVRNLLRSIIAAGPHQVLWNGKNDDGAILPSGIYFYRLEVNGAAQVRKMTLIK